MTKVKLNHPKEISELRTIFESENIKTYESDIRFPTRYLIDNNIQGSIEIDGDYDCAETIDRVYKNPEISSVEYTPNNLKILSFDIETNKNAKEIYCISMFSKNYKKSLIISNKKVKNAILCIDEEE